MIPYHSSDKLYENIDDMSPDMFDDMSENTYEDKTINSMSSLSAHMYNNALNTHNSHGSISSSTSRLSARGGGSLGLKVCVRLCLSTLCRFKDWLTG